MKFIYSLILLHTLTIGFGQDVYHTELLQFLEENHGVSDPAFLIADSEANQINESIYYGASINVEPAAAQDFTQFYDISIASPLENQWDAGLNNSNTTAVSSGDIILICFWAKRSSSQSQIYAFAENASNYEKQYYHQLELTPDWTRYFISFKSSANFNPGAMTIGFHLGAIGQDIQIAGITGLNYGDNYSLTDLPSVFSAANYGGHEADAPWRTLAQSRIEQLRKSNLDIKVVDMAGEPVADANVSIEMEEHAFGFGSALVACRMPGNDCFNTTYVNKLANLDGEGHGFNVAVTENAMKWDGWEEEWIGSPTETANAITWLAERGIETRGHTLFWPGYNMMPDDILANNNDHEYIRERIDGRIESMINHPTMSPLIRDWDILNEITTNRDLEAIFDDEPGFETGRDIYKEIFKKVREADPTLQLYVNDYVVLSGGGSSFTVTSRYEQFLDEISEGEVPFDGIGFQCHIGSSPTSILKLQEVWDSYFQKYQVPLKITEYDMNPQVDQEVAGKYMADFLTMAFSHPAMEAFLMWGFWDGNHWKDNAPIFNLDWSIKPSGQSFIDKVFNEWWTEESDFTGMDGLSSFRPFKGMHKITITKGDAVHEEFINLEDDMDLEIIFDTTNSLAELEENDFKLLPNLMVENNTNFVVNFPDRLTNVDVQIYNYLGQMVANFDQVINHELLQVELPAGSYQVVFRSRTNQVSKKLIVQ